LEKLYKVLKIGRHNYFKVVAVVAIKPAIKKNNCRYASKHCDTTEKFQYLPTSPSTQVGGGLFFTFVNHYVDSP
jgi:hypothetical protein